MHYILEIYTMRTIFKSLLVSSALLVTVQQSYAEPVPNFTGQPPIWNFGQTPIVWGDCVPVPVIPVPYGQNNMPMGQMGMNQASIPQPMMQQFSMPMPMNEQPIILPPPSPFFGNSIPAPMPMPVVADVNQTVCDDSALQALQAKYDQGAAASRAKIAEITQALNDSNNQMIDARVMIDNLSKKTEQDSSKLGSELSMLEMQLTNSRNTNKSLQAKLVTAESNAGNQARKVNALNLSTSELTALKGAYKERSDENAAFKIQLAGLDNTNKSLQAKLSTAESGASDQARKITVLNQSAVELVALQSAYKTRNNENVELKMQLAEFANSNKSLQSQLNTASTNAGSQARKLTVLSQTAPELTALKSAYKERNDENVELNKMLAEMESAYKTLQSQFFTAKTDAGSQARKITVLSQSSTELTALKSAYKERSAESAALKIKLGQLDDAYKSLHAKLGKAESDAGAQARKITALGQSGAELVAAKSAYKARNEENAKLKKMLADLDGAHKSLQAQFSLATKDASTQARKLTVLGQSATELTAIQSAYKEKVNQNIALKTQLAELNSLKKFSESCRAEVSDLGMRLTNTDNKRKSLLGKIATLETTSSGQARKITSLMLTAGELDALKSAYKDLSSKKVELTSKLTKATADTDNDGVLDSSDNCPNSPADTEVNGLGCPNIADSDSDGVADSSDLCSATVAGATVNQFGCEPTENITLKGVTFDTGSARLTTGSIPIVTAAAVTLNKNLNLNVEVLGYTDNQGLEYINKSLSQRRANTVMIQLIKDGVDASRLKAKGYGEKSPVASNKTAEGRATNRRVELKISN